MTTAADGGSWSSSEGPSREEATWDAAALRTTLPALRLHDLSAPPLIELSCAIENDLERRLDAFYFHQHFFDLRGEDVHPPHNDHVVGSGIHFCVAGKGPAARAGPEGHAGEVAGAIAEYGHRLFGERGEDEFAFLALGHSLARRGIDHLRNEVILVYVEPVLGEALAGHPRAYDLRQTIVVGGGDPQASFEFFSHPVGPGFGAEEPHPQTQIVDIKTQFLG